MEQRKPKKFIRRRVVQDMTGLPTSSLYDKISDGTFPKPVPIGERGVAWIEDEVLDWLEMQIAKRDLPLKARMIRVRSNAPPRVMARA